MRFGERPTKHQALGRNLAIAVCAATVGLWGLLASGWDIDSLERYLAGAPAPGHTPAPVATATPRPAVATPRPVTKAAPPKPGAKPSPAAAHLPPGLHLGPPTFQPKRMVLPVTGSLRPLPLMIRTQADGRSYVEIPDTTPMAREPLGFHSPDGEFVDGVLAAGRAGGSRVTFRLKAGAIARAYVASGGVVVAIVDPNRLQRHARQP